MARSRIFLGRTSSGGAAPQTYTELLTSELLVTDAAVKSALRNRTPESALDVLDGPVMLTQARHAGSALSVADEQARLAWYHRALTDNITVSDAERVIHWQVYRTDTLALLDEAIADYIPGATGTTYTETLESLLAVTDATIRTALRNRLQGDAFTTTDATIKSAYRNRRTDDALTLLDGLVRTAVRNRYTSDSFVVADAMLRGLVRGRVASDALTTTDATIKSAYRNRLLGDALTTTDDETHSITGGAVLERTLTSNAVLVDQALRQVLRQRILSDAATLLDQAYSALQRNRLLGDALAVTDGESHSIIGGLVNYRTATSTLNPTDDGPKMRFFDARLGDNAVITDGESHSITGAGNVSTQTKTDNIVLDDSGREAIYTIMAESLAELADASVKSAYRNRLLASTITLADQLLSEVTGGSVISRVATDNVDVTDADRTMYWQIVSTDYASLLDAVSYTIVGTGTTYDRTASDSLATSDDLLKYARRFRRLSDDITVTDGEGHTVVIPGETYSRLASDTIQLTDSELHELFGFVISRTATDGVLVTDDGRTIYWSVQTTENAVAFDEGTATVSQPYLTTRRVTDEVRVGDQIFRVLLRQRYIGDSLPLYDSVGHMPREIVVHAYDDFVLSDNLIYTAAGSFIKVKTATDSITVTDEGRTFYWQIKRSDYIEAIDQLFYTQGAGNATFRTLQDAINFTDQIFKSLVKRRYLSDSITLHDAQLLGMWKEIVTDEVDEILPTDGTIKTAYRRRLLGDAIILADSILGGSLPSTFTHEATDEISVTDQGQRFLRVVRLAGDTLAALDEALAQTFASGNIYSTTLADSVSVTDMAFRGAFRTRFASDTLPVADQLLKDRIYQRGLFDSVEVTDGLIRVRWNTRTLSEFLGISDALLPQYIPFLPYVYEVRIRLGLGVDLPILGVMSEVKFLVSNPVILDAQEDNPLGLGANRIVFGGYN